jgi:hypothetical protein
VVVIIPQIVANRSTVAADMRQVAELFGRDVATIVFRPNFSHSRPGSPQLRLLSIASAAAAPLDRRYFGDVNPTAAITGFHVCCWLAMKFLSSAGAIGRT